MASGKDFDRTLGYMTGKDTETKLPRPTRVKNKNPAPVQITAEQILREARERHNAAEIRPPKQNITDSTELSEYRFRRRQEFEDKIRGVRSNIQNWVNYAQWEESQKNYDHARSVWERAVKYDYRNHTLWLKYAEFEMKNKFVNEARNVWDRAVTLLPRVDQLWYKYIHMEEKLGNISEARGIFERWINQSPDQQGWLSFIKFELRYNEIERARSIHERFILCNPEAALDHNPIGIAEEFDNEDSIVGKRRIQYEDEVRKNPLNYDSWFDYVRLEESLGNKDKIRKIYERAIANIPPATEEKRYWQRYIYLWINYALYEEIEAEDVERTRNVYRECLKLIPHKRFSFGKIWLLAAEFEIRQLNLDNARKILGNAIGNAPKGKIFKKYIEIELQLGNIDRCRKLYERFLEWSPENCYAWRNFAELERSLGETERARAVFELAISRSYLDMPEVIWKGYIDFEMSQGEVERTRVLYERLLERSKHYKVWVSFAKFEASVVEQCEEEDVIEHKKECIRRVRAIFDRANEYYKQEELKEERDMLLEDWMNMEMSFGELGDVSVVEMKLPKKLKKRKPITTNLKILEAAYKWKKQKVAASDLD